MLYNTRGLRSSDQKLVLPAILYPFYRERQKCWQTELQGNQSHHKPHLYGLFPRNRTPLAEENFVIDYRKLNGKTINDKYPILEITDILDKLGSAKYFSTLDLKSGFHQIQMAKEYMENVT